jgi:hypothetical protein
MSRRATLRAEERVCLHQGTCTVLLKDRKECTHCRCVLFFKGTVSEMNNY